MHDLVRLDMDLSVGRCGHRHIAAWILDIYIPVIGKGLIHLDVVVMLLAHHREEIVAVIAELAAEGTPPVPVGAPSDRRQQKDEKYYAADRAPPRIGIVPVQEIFAQRYQPYQDQKHGPPAPIPAPEAAGAQVSGLKQEGDDTDG